MTESTEFTAEWARRVLDPEGIPTYLYVPDSQHESQVSQLRLAAGEDKLSLTAAVDLLAEISPVFATRRRNWPSVLNSLPRPPHPQRALPSFEGLRRDAYRLLGDAADSLVSSCREGTGPNEAQRDARARALRAIGVAKDALNEAATSWR